MQNINPTVLLDYRTVKGFAARVRQRAIKAQGEAGFARQCLEFEHKLHFQVEIGSDSEDYAAEGTEGLTVLKQVLHIVAVSRDLESIQLALCWLDGAGYGQLTLEELRRWLTMSVEDSSEA